MHVDVENAEQCEAANDIEYGDTLCFGDRFEYWFCHNEGAVPQMASYLSQV